MHQITNKSFFFYSGLMMLFKYGKSLERDLVFSCYIRNTKNFRKSDANGNQSGNMMYSWLQDCFFLQKRDQLMYKRFKKL